MADAQVLPKFKAPPIAEVALAVQLEPGSISGLDAAQFRARVRDRFPKVEEHPPGSPMREDFGPRAGTPGFTFEVVAPPAMPRYWFLTEEGDQLIQLQHDFFAYNWRRWPTGEGEYPSYDSLIADFRNLLSELVEMIGEEHAKELSFNWCEVTYINHIEAVAGTEDLAAPEEVFAFFRDAGSAFLPTFEGAQGGVRYLIPGEGEKPRGRLTVSLGSGTRNTDDAPIWLMNLTARVLSDPPTEEGALMALDEGHKWVVTAFADLTTPQMHKLWKREA
jgi:uncharacterized protein (TIGR04255 family)